LSNSSAVTSLFATIDILKFHYKSNGAQHQSNIRRILPIVPIVNQ